MSPPKRCTRNARTHTPFKNLWVSDPRKTLTIVNWKLTRAGLHLFSSKLRSYWFYVLYLILAEPGTELLSWVHGRVLHNPGSSACSPCAKKICKLLGKSTTRPQIFDQFSRWAVQRGGAVEEAVASAVGDNWTYPL